MAGKDAFSPESVPSGHPRRLINSKARCSAAATPRRRQGGAAARMSRLPRARRAPSWRRRDSRRSAGARAGAARPARARPPRGHQAPAILLAPADLRRRKRRLEPPPPRALSRRPLPRRFSRARRPARSRAGARAPRESARPSVVRFPEATALGADSRLHGKETRRRGFGAGGLGARPGPRGAARSPGRLARRAQGFEAPARARPRARRHAAAPRPRICTRAASGRRTSSTSLRLSSSPRLPSGNCIERPATPSGLRPGLADARRARAAPRRAAREESAEARGRRARAAVAASRAVTI